MDIYADVKNLHKHHGMMKKLYDLGMKFNDPKRITYYEDKSKPESKKMLVAAAIVTKNLLEVEMANGGSHTYCPIAVKAMFRCFFMSD